MFGNLLKVILLMHAVFKSGSTSKSYKFIKVSDVFKIPIVEMSSRSTQGRLSCAGLCSDGCWFHKYEESGSGSGTCELFKLSDTIYSDLKFVNISNLYKKVYPPDNVFVGELETKTWNEARDFCQSLGGYLAIANSTTKVDRMFKLMNEAHIWVGGQKNGTSWKWLSGADVTPPPSEDQGQECLGLYRGTLDDHNCSAKLESVCEYQL